MKNIIVRLDKIFNFFEDSSLNFSRWVFTIFTIFTLRFFIETATRGSFKVSTEFFISTYFLGIVLFFLLMNLVFTIIFLKITGKPLNRISSGVLWGMLIMIFPPIFDKLIFRDKITWSFYLFDSLNGLLKRFVTFFGDSPDLGITIGTRIGAFFVCTVFALYLFSIKKKWWYLLFGWLLSYCVVFLFSSMPSLISYFLAILNGQSVFLVNSVDVANNFLKPFEIFSLRTKTPTLSIHFKMAIFYNIFLFFTLVYLQKILDIKKLKALFLNVRFPQMIFNCGLFFLGLLLGVKYFPHNFEFNTFSILIVLNLLLSILFAWKYSVIVNDLNDLEIDKLSDANKNRPLVKKVFEKEEYKIYGFIFMFLSLLSALTVNVLFFFLILLYIILTFIYSNPPLRLRRFIGVSSFLSSLASLIFLLMGFLLVSDNQSLMFFPWRIVLFLFVFYGFILPIKDLKDMEADRKNGVITIATVFGEKKARDIISLLMLIAYTGSVFLLVDFSLFFPAILFGGLSYFIIGDKRIKADSLLFWNLLFVFMYGLYIVLTSFE